MRRIFCYSILVVAILFGATATGYAAVDLRWRPEFQVVHTGDSVDVGFYALSDSGADWPISAMEVIMLYNPDHLDFYDISTVGAPYQWLMNGFLSPSPDDLNLALDDGEMMYSAWAQLGVAAKATPSGLLVTTLRFLAKDPVSRTYITIPLTFGTQAKTRVFDGATPNLNVTGSLGTATIMVVPVGVLTSVAAAKAQADGSSVDLAGPISTRSFASYFYLEDFDRTAGIRVNCDPGEVQPEGTTPMVTGIIDTVDGERVIQATIVTPGDAMVIPKPYGVNIRATGGGLSPAGLLVKVAGRVVSLSPVDGTFELFDGTTSNLRVELHGLPTPDAGVFLAVTGALGADTSGTVLRVNNSQDLRTIPE
ncbi:MAG: hypothetical protein HYX78_04175 [Armatimonadetes bacterium]|nr:hypothetical protein [Armatimonadota bacterium]